MKSDLKMPAPSQCFVHKPNEKRQLEHCIEKAMLDLLSKCMFGGIMITYNAPGFPLYYIDEQMLSLLPRYSLCLCTAFYMPLYSYFQREGPVRSLPLHFRGPLAEGN